VKDREKLLDEIGRVFARAAVDAYIDERRPVSELPETKAAAEVSPSAAVTSTPSSTRKHYERHNSTAPAANNSSS
jgi:hypothetical protein